MKISLLINIILLVSTNVYSQESLKGHIKDKSNNAIFAATVRFIQPSGKQTICISDMDGNFSLDVKRINKNDSLIISSLGYKDKIISPFLSDTLLVILEDATTELDEVNIISKPSISKEFAIETIKPIDIYMTPGSSGDPLKAITSLSYSTNNPETANIELRGSSSSYTRVILNNVPIYKPTRNQQLNSNRSFSILNPQIINRQEVYASNPPLKYGNTLAGLIDVSTTNKITSRNSLKLNLSIANIGIYYATKINSKSFIQLYSNYQFSSIYKNLNIGLEDLNQFKTIDGGLNYRCALTEKFNINLYSYAIDEEYSGTDYSYNYKGLSEAEKKRTFNILNLEWQLNNFNISYNQGFDYSRSLYKFGPIEEKHDENRIYSSLDLKYYFKNNIIFQTGISNEYSHHNYEGKQPSSFYSYLDDKSFIDLEKDISNNNTESYLYVKANPFKKFKIGAGIRKNLPHKNQINYWSKQINFRYNLTKSNSLLLSAGDYNGYSDPYRNIRDIHQISSNQYTFEHLMNYKLFSLSYALFYKEETIPLNPQPYQTISPLRIKGIEIASKFTITKMIETNVTYSYMNTKMKLDNFWQRYYTDNSNILKCSLRYTNPKLFNFGINFFYQSGKYFHNIITNRVPNRGNISSRSYYNDKLNNYYSLNLSANKYIKLKDVGIVCFFNINNILNHKNPSYAYYNEDYTEISYRYLQARMIYFGIQLDLNNI